jgi:modulator of FtsH protease HflK
LKKIGIIVGLLLLGYLATGFYVVRGNEQAVVRRFGKVSRTASGVVQLRGSGLHYDLPAPFTQIDRVNLNEVLTVTIGLSELEPLAEDDPLKSAAQENSTYFLTGDKNILNIKLGIQYRVSEEQIDRYLFHTTPQGCEQHLKALTESILTDLVTRSGVDFMQTHGRSEIQRQLTEHLREMTQKRQLGVRIDTVTLERIEPPLRVRAAFLDVNDARADKEKYIYAASTYARERREAARAENRRILDESEIYRQQTTEQVKAEAEGFHKLIDRIEESPVAQRKITRQLALTRLYLETMETLLSRAKTKVILESDKPIDITFPGNSGR